MWFFLKGHRMKHIKTNHLYRFISDPIVFCWETPVVARKSYGFSWGIWMQPQSTIPSRFLKPGWQENRPSSYRGFASSKIPCMMILKWINQYPMLIFHAIPSKISPWKLHHSITMLVKLLVGKRSQCPLDFPWIDSKDLHGGLPPATLPDFWGHPEANPKTRRSGPWNDRNIENQETK